MDYYSLKVGAYAPLCIAEGSSLTRARVAKPQEFTIKTFSIQNTEIKHKTSEEFSGFLQEIDGDTKVDIVIKNKNNGTYSAFYSTQKAGKVKKYFYIFFYFFIFLFFVC
jgi:hypothetical protein